MIITISQSTANQEIINFDILNKIYNLYKTGGLNTISLEGNLYSAKGYKQYADELVEAFSPNLVITIPEQGQYLVFEDSLLEQKLITSFSSDGFGVTLGDARTAALGTTFKDDTNITSFNEFKYFTRANTSPVSEMFNGCTNLSSIDLSEVTSFSSKEFFNTAITDVNAPNLTSVPSGSAHIFSNNQSLLTITSLGHITYIPGDMCQGCGNLQSVNIPAECVEIQNGAFYPYRVTGSLQTVTGLENVASFGDKCFRDQKQLQLTAQDLAGAILIGGNSFKEVKVSSINSPKLTTLGEYSFGACPITTIECLGKVSNIPNCCFEWNQSLQTVKIPYECTILNNGAFQNCTSLTSIKQYTDSVDNWVEGVEPTTGPLSRVTSFGNNCFKDCSLLNLTQQNIQNAAIIGNGAFKNTLLSGPIDLPNATSIGSDAFSGTSITSITDLGSIGTIPESCFNNCNSLTTVTLPNTCNSISNLAFAQSSALTTINLGNITSIGDYAFGVCTHLTGNYVLPNLNSIGTGAFNQSGVISVDFTGSTIVSISDGCFRACAALTSITLPNTCTNIGSSAFRDATSLTTINLDNIVSIGSSYTFGGTKIVNFMLPNIQTIADSAFRWCKYSQLIDMGPNLSSVGGRAFYESTFTVFIFRGATVPAYDANKYPTFLSNMSGVTIYVPESALNDYKTAWPAMASNIVKIEGSVYDT